MTNWINSGSPATRQCTDSRTSDGRVRVAGSEAMLGLGAAALLAVASVQLVQARDIDGRYVHSPLKPLFDSLKSGKGPCCSDADGSVVADVDWESKEGHYRVRIEGEWFDVPEDAVITGPNRAGRTMVWPIKGYLGMTIRCFMPGSMT